MVFLYLIDQVRVCIFQTVALLMDTNLLQMMPLYLRRRFFMVRRGSSSDGLAKRFSAIVLLQQSKQFVFRLLKVLRVKF